MRITDKDWLSIKKDLEKTYKRLSGGKTIKVDVPFDNQTMYFFSMEFSNLIDNEGFYIVNHEGKIRVALIGELVPYEDDYTRVVEMNLVDNLENTELKSAVMATLYYLMENTVLTNAYYSVTKTIAEDFMMNYADNVYADDDQKTINDIKPLIEQYLSEAEKDATIKQDCKEAYEMTDIDNLSSIKTNNEDENRLIKLLSEIIEYTKKNDLSVEESHYYGNHSIDISPYDRVLISRTSYVPIMETIYSIAEIAYDGDTYEQFIPNLQIIKSDSIDEVSPIHDFSLMLYDLNEILETIYKNNHGSTTQS